MKILLTSIGVPGHLNPLLAAAAILGQHHEVAVQTSDELRPAVDAAGIRFIAELPHSRTFVGHYLADHPAVFTLTDRFDTMAFNFEHFLAEKIAVHAANLAHALQGFPADLILADSFFFGTLPMLLRDGPRPAVAHLGVSMVNVHSAKSMRPHPGATDDEARAEREAYAQRVLAPTQVAFDAALATMRLGPLPCPALESPAALADLYLHPGVESFEYPQGAAKVHYIGQLPMAAGQGALPQWWVERDQTKRVVLVTQGTIANRDLAQLVGPALTALANEEDVLVIVTTGGPGAEAIPVAIPANARVADFLPYQLIFPHVDALITNGGYGTVNLALAHGIPVVSAGLTEDKEETSAHVAWAGVGIDLHTIVADPATLRQAVRSVLDESSYRQRAAQMATEFAQMNAGDALLRFTEQCVEQRGAVSSSHVGNDAAKRLLAAGEFSAAPEPVSDAVRRATGARAAAEQQLRGLCGGDFAE